MVISQTKGENYWQPIKEYLLQADGKDANQQKAISQNYQRYIQSLTNDQLFIAAKQCSAEANVICPETIFCEEASSMWLAFFLKEYPNRTGLRDITPIINDIRDANQSNFWRASLIEFLGSDRRWKLLTNEQLYEIVSNLDPIIRSASEHYRLRVEASRTTRNILSEIEKRNLLAEPIINESLQNEQNLMDLKRKAEKSEISLSDNYKNAQAKTLAYYEQFSKSLIFILQKADLEFHLRSEGWGNLAGICLNKSIASRSQAEEILTSSVRSYKQYDERLWRNLLYISFDNLKLPDSNDIAQNMLNELQNKLKSEKNKQKKNQIQSEIDSINYIIKEHKKQ